MRYLIIEKNSAPADPFSEMVSAGDEVSYTTHTADLGDSEVSDLRQAPEVADIVPSMPFTLIEPVSEQPAAEPQSENSWGIAAIGAEQSEFDGAETSVAILDTGIDLGHAAFRDIRFSPIDLMDFTGDDRGAAGAEDTAGHGTLVAGVVFGRDVDGVRIGVARGVQRVLIGKVIDDHGGSTESVYNGLLWALARGADIVSLSLGIDFTAYAENLVDQGYPVRIATSRALQAYRANVRLFDSLGKMVQTASLSVRGAIIVVAAGNESRRTDDPRFTVETTPPGIAEGFLSVGALRKRADGQAWSVANFSNTGCQLSAPGVRILSAKLGGGLRESSGTSMAAPHVAGILALWMQRLYPDGRHPVGWPKQVIREVRAHLLKLPGCAESDVGAGLVQAPHP